MELPITIWYKIAKYCDPISRNNIEKILHLEPGTLTSKIRIPEGFEQKMSEIKKPEWKLKYYRCVICHDYQWYDIGTIEFNSKHRSKIKYEIFVTRDRDDYQHAFSRIDQRNPSSMFYGPQHQNMNWVFVCAEDYDLTPHLYRQTNCSSKELKKFKRIFEHFNFNWMENSEDSDSE